MFFACRLNISTNFKQLALQYNEDHCTFGSYEDIENNLLDKIDIIIILGESVLLSFKWISKYISQFWAVFHKFAKSPYKYTSISMKCRNPHDTICFHSALRQNSILCLQIELCWQGKRHFSLPSIFLFEPFWCVFCNYTFRYNVGVSPWRGGLKTSPD